MAEFKDFPYRWPSDEWLDIMPLAQHHGIPTRLLDWSRRARVAAYFAAVDAMRLRHAKSPRLGDRLGIWELETGQLEKLTFEEEPAQQQLERIFPSYDSTNIPPEGPPGVRVISAPGSASPHLAAQSGLFTLQRERGDPDHPPKFTTLEAELLSTPTVLQLFTLPVTEAKELGRLCMLNDVTATTAYRTFDGAGKAVIDWLEDMSESHAHGTNFAR